MLKFKAFCLDYWQFLCLQPLHGVYKRYVPREGLCRGAAELAGPSPAWRPQGLLVLGQGPCWRLLWATGQLGSIVPSSSSSPEAGRISAEKGSPPECSVAMR